MSASLELRGIQPRQQEIRNICLDSVALSGGSRVLEIGYGTGSVTRILAKLIKKKGEVTALDPSFLLLEEARTRTQRFRRVHSNCARVSFVQGNGYHLDFAKSVFDVSVAFNVLSHLEKFNFAIKQMNDVTVKGGKVLVMDDGFQTLVFNHSYMALTQKIVQHGSMRTVLNPWCSRKLLEYMTGASIRKLQCRAFAYAERDAQSYLMTSADQFANICSKDGVITDSQAEAWLSELTQRDWDGTFYASLNCSKKKSQVQ